MSDCEDRPRACRACDQWSECDYRLQPNSRNESDFSSDPDPEFLEHEAQLALDLITPLKLKN